MPSLSSDGWVNTPMKTLDFLFSHLFLTDYSQSYIYYTRITSIPYIMFKNQTSVGQLVSDLRDNLVLYFSRYYDTVNCDIIENESIGTSSSLTIFLEVVDGNESFTLSKVIEYTDSKITGILDYNNYGVVKDSN